MTICKIFIGFFSTKNVLLTITIIIENIFEFFFMLKTFLWQIFVCTLQTNLDYLDKK